MHLKFASFVCSFDESECDLHVHLCVRKTAHRSLLTIIIILWFINCIIVVLLLMLCATKHLTNSHLRRFKHTQYLLFRMHELDVRTRTFIGIFYVFARSKRNELANWLRQTSNKRNRMECEVCKSDRNEWAERRNEIMNMFIAHRTTLCSVWFGLCAISVWRTEAVFCKRVRPYAQHKQHKWLTMLAASESGRVSRQPPHEFQVRVHCNHTFCIEH